MDELYSRCTYLFATIGAFFSSLTLVETGFLLGVIISTILGILNYLLNRRSQLERTKIWRDYLENVKHNNEQTPEQALKEFLTNKKQEL